MTIIHLIITLFKKNGGNYTFFDAFLWRKNKLTYYSQLKISKMQSGTLLSRKQTVKTHTLVINEQVFLNICLCIIQSYIFHWMLDQPEQWKFLGRSAFLITKYRRWRYSKSFASVKSIYTGIEVQKLDCVGYIQKRVCTRLRNLKKNVKNFAGKENWQTKLLIAGRITTG